MALNQWDCLESSTACQCLIHVVGHEVVVIMPCSSMQQIVHRLGGRVETRVLYGFQQPLRVTLFGKCNNYIIISFLIVHKKLIRNKDLNQFMRNYRILGSTLTAYVCYNKSLKHQYLYYSVLCVTKGYIQEIQYKYGSSNVNASKG